VIGKTHRRLWKAFEKLPVPIQDLAREKYAMWKRDPFHPSLGFEERRNNVCVVRIGDHYRALWPAQQRLRRANRGPLPRTLACEKVILFCGFGLARTKITTGFGSNCVSSGPRADACLILAESDQLAVHVLPTQHAVALYNKLAQTEPVGGLFHTTC